MQRFSGVVYYHFGGMPTVDENAVKKTRWIIRRVPVAAIAIDLTHPVAQAFFPIDATDVAACVGAMINYRTQIIFTTVSGDYALRSIGCIDYALAVSPTTITPAFAIRHIDCPDGGGTRL